MTQPLTKRPDAFTETAIDDEVVVMHLASGEFFSLTGSSAAIWRLIDGTRGAEAIVAELAAAYGEEPGRIADDLAAFVAQLQAAGLVEA